MALVANELLAFIQHAIDTMDEVSIMQICKSSFNSEEICKGKQLLYETLGQSANMPSRRRDGTERSVQDIISLLKQTDPDDVPAFVAKDLHKLPVVTMDHVDVSSLLKNFNSMKAELDEMREEKPKETHQEEKSEEEAARKIQAAFRGHQTRKSVTMKSAKPEPEPTKAELEAEFRADDKDVVNAATKIQASFRGHQARKQTQADKEKELKEQQEQQDKEDIEKIDLTDPDLNKAATKIQASFRGHKVRKDV